MIPFALYTNAFSMIHVVECGPPPVLTNAFSMIHIVECGPPPVLAANQCILYDTCS